MHNKVVYHAAKALEDVGFVTLRINFRGVGASSGAYDEGRGEADDARVGLAGLLADQPAARDVLLAGFSFGASIALRVGCAEARVRRLISIGTPAGWLSPETLAGCAKPIGFVHGAVDDVTPLAALQALLAATRRGAATQLQVIPAAGHFFSGQFEALRAAVAAAAELT
ncbi:MAG: hypothetical protein ABI629_05725 [bacterium]